MSRGVVRVEDENETLYKGTWRRNKRHGRGIEVDLEEGSYYIGEWKDDLKEGYGRLVLECGNIYEGDWAEGVAHGSGKLRTNI